MIIRVFRAIVQDGMQSEFQDFFAEKALPRIRQQRGLISVQVGTPSEITPDELLMVTTWRDLDSLKGFAGEDWAEPVIDPAEEHMLKETFLHHYFDLS